MHVCSVFEWSSPNLTLFLLDHKALSYIEQCTCKQWFILHPEANAKQKNESSPVFNQLHSYAAFFILFALFLCPTVFCQFNGNMLCTGLVLWLCTKWAINWCMVDSHSLAYIHWSTESSQWYHRRDPEGHQQSAQGLSLQFARIEHLLDPHGCHKQLRPVW